MPELPEVQTIVDDLNKKVRGRKIVAAWHDWLKLKAVDEIVGHTIKNVVRRGKNILFYLDKDTIFLVHQKMTGHLLVGKWSIHRKKIEPISPPALKDRVNGYIHFVLTLDDGRMIGFSDLRKFGKVLVGANKKVEQLSELTNLGPDAVTSNISFNDFQKRIAKRSKTIYQVLMDQSVIAGVGNIYASEILWQATTHPFKIAKKLTADEAKQIWSAMKIVFQKALKLRGTSSGDYRDTAGEEGDYYKQRVVYDREGLPCYKCGTKIKRAKKGGRSAFYCERCQRQ